ncbi:SPOR domain-containing protein [Methyloraptor flagellatus]|uniref:SPOR domain-containing protein n=1 Tax=Methyloraptor flagellatus TaxID=3162530 RepID=A0AAU7XEU3_9HYPH
MPEKLQHVAAARVAGGAAPAGQVTGGMPEAEDPLVELARIVSEGAAYPVRPEPRSGQRRPVTAQPMPQQLTELEAELFNELRASVGPAQARSARTAEHAPEGEPVQRQAPNLRVAASRDAPQNYAPSSAGHPGYAQPGHGQSGVAAGSYDPAFDQGYDDGVDGRAPHTASVHVHPAVAHAAPRSPYADFSRDDIAAAAYEARPHASLEEALPGHSGRQVRAAAKNARNGQRIGVGLVAALVGLVAVGGVGYAGWRMFAPSLGVGGAPVTVHADGKPMKVVPPPGKAVADNTPSLKPDDGSGASKIVRLQEDPVDAVKGKTADGQDVRVIAPGGVGVNDQPRHVKTVIVRPDGTVVGDAPKPPRTALADPATPPATQAPALPPVAHVPAAQAPARPSATADMPYPPNPLVQVPAAQAPAAQAPTAPQITTIKPVVKPAPAPTVVATTPVQPAQPRPVQLQPAPAAAPTTTAGAPIALGPVGPTRLAAAPPAAAPATTASTQPVSITPPAGAGDFLVQIAATGSDAEAKRAFAEAQRKYPVLGGRSLVVQQADVNGKSYHRVRVSAGSRDQAVALCEQLKSAGGSCMVVKR